MVINHDYCYKLLNNKWKKLFVCKPGNDIKFVCYDHVKFRTQKYVPVQSETQFY